MAQIQLRVRVGVFEDGVYLIFNAVRLTDACTLTLLDEVLNLGQHLLPEVLVVGLSEEVKANVSNGAELGTIQVVHSDGEFFEALADLL